MNTKRKATGLAVALAACCALIGCGGSDAPGLVEGRRLDLLIADCSASFRASSQRLLPEMVSIARDSAAQERVLWAGCFAGAPLRTLAWKPRVDFGSLPKGIEPDTRLADSFNEARALGLESKLSDMVRETVATEPGSGQLEALEVASEAVGVGRVFLFTDAAIHEPQVPELSTATPSDIRRTVRLWAPRLSGLRGAHLILIGVGYGVHNSASVRAAKQLFRGLADQTGAASFQWTQELPATFPAQESG